MRSGNEKLIHLAELLKARWDCDIAIFVALVALVAFVALVALVTLVSVKNEAYTMIIRTIRESDAAQLLNLCKQLDAETQWDGHFVDEYYMAKLLDQPTLST